MHRVRQLQSEGDYRNLAYISCFWDDFQRQSLSPTPPVMPRSTLSRRSSFIGSLIEEEKKSSLDFSLAELYEDKQVAEAMELSKKALARSLYDEAKFEQAALILKRCKAIEPMRHCLFGKTFSGTNKLEFIKWCPECKSPLSNCQCSRQYNQGIHCTICQRQCRGIVLVCVLCGHGGHYQHMIDWFAEETECASGCGCLCKLKN
jgi:hypothetical protein